jgi:hypothetical protein
MGMIAQLIENQPTIHQRDISLATYAHTDSRIVVHGVLEDRRNLKVFDVTGFEKNPGVLHYMEVWLLIKPGPLIIEAAEARMDCTPLPECSDTLDNVAKLAGLEIKSGFSKKIREIIGGKQGCAHLCQLITVMGQESVQGWLTDKRRDKPKLPQDVKSLKEKNYLYNSCRMWSNTGPKFKNLERAIKQKQSLGD